MRSYSPESIQCAEENKMKALLALSRKSSLLVDGARDELLSFAFPFGNERRGALEGKAKNNFISFPLNIFSAKFHFIVFQSVSSSIFPSTNKKMRVFVGKIIYVPPRTTPVALRRYMNKDYSEGSTASVLHIFFRDKHSQSSPEDF